MPLLATCVALLVPPCLGREFDAPIFIVIAGSRHLFRLRTAQKFVRPCQPLPQLAVKATILEQAPRHSLRTISSVNSNRRISTLGQQGAAHPAGAAAATPAAAPLAAAGSTATMA
jgi:hypothetical protein